MGLAPNYTQYLAAPAGALMASLSEASPAGVKSAPSVFCSEPLLASFAGEIIQRSAFVSSPWI